LGANVGQRLSELPRSGLLQDIRAFLLDCQARRLSPRTVSRYGDELRYWREWLNDRDVTTVRDVTANHLRSYLIHLESQGRNAGGQHIAFRVLRTFLKWYEREYEPANWKNPIGKVTAPKLPQDPLAPVPLADVRAMLATCEPRTFYGDRDRAALLFLLDSGCRAAEFLALNVNDIDLTTGAVRIYLGKGGKSRVTFLGAKARKALLAYLRHRQDVGPGGALWVNTGGDRLTYWGLRQIVTRRAKAAGVPAYPLHAFRRAFALGALRNGMDLVSLQRILGHADLSVIRRYLKQSQDDLQAAHAKGSPVDGLL
jgi:site-specific recombinase XerD